MENVVWVNLSPRTLLLLSLREAASPSTFSSFFSGLNVRSSLVVVVVGVLSLIIAAFTEASSMLY